MSAISTYLEYIRSKIYAKDVRTAIVNAISQCYDDVNAPALQTEAMQAAVQAKIDAGEMAALTVADGSLTGAKLADGTIPTAKIADGAITTAKIADGAVTGAKVGTGTLTGDNIANKAIGTAKIDDSAVTWQKLANEAVHTAEIADGAVTSAKLGNVSVTIEKLSPDVRNAIENASGLSDDAKVALLNCFAHVAWLDDVAPDALAELEAALYEDDYPRLSVTFNPDGITIYDDFTEQNIRDLMTVKYYRAAGDYDVITNYSLTYSLATATTQIIVSYSGLSRTVTTNVAIGRPLTASDIESHVGYVDFAIDADGNISCSDATSFSAIVLDSSIKHIRFTPSYTNIDTRKDVAAWMVYHKESSTVVYGNSVAHSFVFTSNGSKYGAQQDDSKATVTIENNDQFIANTRKDAVLSNGVLTLCEAFTPSARYMITNANVIGVWTDAAQDSSPKNVRVYSE